MADPETSGSATPPAGAAPSSATPPSTPPPAARAAAPTEPPDAGDEEEVRDPAALLRTYKQLQEREKAQRSRLSALEAAQKQADDAKLSEQERLTKRVAELEAADKTRTATTSARILGYEIKLQAQALGIIDPDAAAKLLDLGSLEYDADGAPTNLDKALKSLVKDKPYLQGAAPGTGQQPPAAQVNPTNPASRSAAATATRRYNAADLADTAFYDANREDIIRAQRENRIDL